MVEMATAIRTTAKSVDTIRSMFSDELRQKYLEDIIPLNVEDVERRIYDIRGDLMIKVPRSSIRAVAVRPSTGKRNIYLSTYNTVASNIMVNKPPNSLKYPM